MGIERGDVTTAWCKGHKEGTAFRIVGFLIHRCFDITYILLVWCEGTRANAASTSRLYHTAALLPREGELEDFSGMIVMVIVMMMVMVMVMMMAMVMAMVMVMVMVMGMVMEMVMLMVIEDGDGDGD